MFADVPLSVGILEPCSHPLHLNTVEFLWDPAKNASVFIQVEEDLHPPPSLSHLQQPSVFSNHQVNCISTEFTPRKHGGEKGVPFRIQVDTFSTNENGEYMEHVHSSSCQVKVFKVSCCSEAQQLPCSDLLSLALIWKPKGADRKLKTDREKTDRRSPQDRQKYQLSHDTTLLTEVRPPVPGDVSVRSSLCLLPLLIPL